MMPDKDINPVYTGSDPGCSGRACPSACWCSFRERGMFCIPALRLEITRLERRFLEETKAHDKTRHVLECRERELERIRSNMYKERVEEMQKESK